MRRFGSVVPGLYAAGERARACPRSQPAGRQLAVGLSNVFGRGAGAAARCRRVTTLSTCRNPEAMVVGWVSDIPVRYTETKAGRRHCGALQQSMDNNAAAVFPHRETLKQALTDIHALRGRYSPGITVRRETLQHRPAGSHRGTSFCWSRVTVVGALNLGVPRRSRPRGLI